MSSRLHSKILTVVGWKVGKSARRRAEGANMIVREPRVETAGRSSEGEM